MANIEAEIFEEIDREKATAEIDSIRFIPFRRKTATQATGPQTNISCPRQTAAATMKLSICATILIVGISGVTTAFQAPQLSRVAAPTTTTSLNVAPSTLKAPKLDEVCETTGVTLKRYMNEVAMLNPEMTELVTLFGAIDTACKAIANLVKRSQLPSSETLGYQGEINVQGEDQKKLDVITNDLLKRALRFTGRIGVLASEEEDVPVSNQQTYSRMCL